MTVRSPDRLPVELMPPDIEPYRSSNVGIPYYMSFDSGQPGPHVLINAVIHGNELCGALAVDHLLANDTRPTRGRLSLGFANAAALRLFDPADPLASRYIDEDMNRLWSPMALSAPCRSAERDRARQLQPLIDTVDLLLDIHSMQHRTPPLVLAGPHEKGLALARALGFPQHIVRDTGHASGTRLRDYGRFGDADAPQNALLIECGQHWEQAALRVALESAYRFLRHAGMLGSTEAAPPLAETLPSQEIIEVTAAITIESDRFRFAEAFAGMEILEAGASIGWDGDREIVAPYDGCILIMPSRHLQKGQTAVRLGRMVSG